jgi:hypothetical protein
VEGPRTGAKIALCSAHVSAPHRFRRYFPEDWLSFVRDEHVRCLLEARSVDGRDVISSEPSVPLTETFRHGGLDLAAFVVRTSTTDKDFPTIAVATGTVDCVGSDVSVHGHTLAGDAGSGDEAVTPHLVRGRIALIDGESRGFLDTCDEETVMGMCGGPVLDSAGECIGLLEGLVPHLGANDKPLSSYHAKIGGCSVYIRARELLPFIADVETEWERDRGQCPGKERKP